MHALREDLLGLHAFRAELTGPHANWQPSSPASPAWQWWASVLVNNASAYRPIGVSEGIVSIGRMPGRVIEKYAVGL